ASAPRQRPSRSAPPSGGGAREAAARGELPQRIQGPTDRRLQRADPLDDLTAVSELEVLDTGERIVRTVGQAVHVVAADPELSHAQHRAPFEQIEGTGLGVRSAPAAVE